LLLYDAYYEELERYAEKEGGTTLSLGVGKGGMLSVADDLMKNEGKKFLEMMEKLAERRMRRQMEEEEQQKHIYQQQHQPSHQHQPQHQHTHLHLQQQSSAHNQPQQQFGLKHGQFPQSHEYDNPSEEDDEDDEEEEYEDEYEDEEDEDEDGMTEEQRLEEGKRMFQMFAAKMFEQRVLTAYREKVAEEKQRKLIEEEEEREKAEKKLKKKQNSVSEN